ncbi:MAG: hypothetical protein ACYCPN_02290 [Thermoplasmata archaeon]
MTDSGARRTPEHAMALIAARHLEQQGYRAWIDPDGQDYFDLAATRGEEVGLVELKARSPGRVLAQALHRRAWGDWGCVAVGTRLGAERLVERTRVGIAHRVGIWWIRGEEVRALREPEPWPEPLGTDRFERPRRLLRERLRQLSRGELPAGLRWTGLAAGRRRVSGGRGFGEWRLEEFEAATDGPPTPDGSTRD